MTVDVAEAQIKVGLSDEGAIAGLRRVEAAYDRTMENIRHQRAVAQVDADLKPLQRKLDVAKAEVRKLAGQRAAVLISADVEPLERKVREAKARVKTLSAEKATILAEMPTAHLERDVADAKAAVDRIKALRARVIIDAGIRPLEEKLAEAKAQVKGFEDAKKLVATFDGNIEPFDRRLAEAKAKVKEFEGEIARGDVVVEYDEEGYSEAMAELARLRAAVKDADGQRATVELAVRGNTEDLELALDQARNEMRKAQFDLNDAEIRISGDITPLDNDLAEAEAHVKKTAAILSTTKVAIDANTSDLDEALVRAKAEVAEAEAEWADVSVDVRAKTAELDAALAKAQAEVAALDGQVAEVEVRVKGERSTLEDLAAIRHERDQAAMAAERLAAGAQRALDADSTARRRLSLEHGAALRMDMKRQQLLDSEPLKVAKAQAQVTRLYNEYTRATKAVERLARTRVPLGREARAEHVAAVAGARAKLLLLKAQLQALGAHPPVEIKVDTDVDRGRIKRRFFLAKESMKGVLDKVGSLGDLTARIGPFTASIKQIGLALAVLGPTITDLVGGAGALVGVLGTGIAGAASVSAGALLGFGQAGLGVFAALKPVVTQFQALNTISKAVTTAQLKYGASSKQAKQAQDQLNSALKGVSPTTRQAFQGLTKLRQEWHKATDDQAKRSFGHVIAEGVKTAGALMPQFAAQTNKTLQGLDKGTSKWMQGLRSAEGRNILDTTFSNANRSLGPLMSGIGSLATAIGRIAASASKLLPSLTQGFAKWAQGLADGVSNGARVDAVIQRIVGHMQDLGHWAMSLGRLLVTVFNGGADAGDKMVQDMTATFDRWNQDLKGNGGKGLRDFFSRAVKGTEALASALGPIVRAFVGLSTNLSPFVTGLFQGVSAVGQLANKLLDITALRGPMAALGAVIGGAFAVSRVGKFVDLLMRAGQLIKAEGFVKGLGMIATGKGGIFGGPAAGLSGTAAATEISVAMEGAGANVAAMIRAAMIQGGTAAAGEEAAAMTGGGAIAAAESAGGVTLGRGVAGAAGSAAGGMAAGEAALAGSGAAAAATSTALTLGLTAVAAAAVYGGYKLFTMKTSAEKLDERLHKLRDVTGQVSTTTQQYATAGAKLPAAHKSYAAAVNSVVKAKQHLAALDKAGKHDTQAYRDGVYNLNQQLQIRADREQQVRNLTATKINAGLKLNQDLRPRQVDASKIVRDAGRTARQARADAMAAYDASRQAGASDEQLAAIRKQLFGENSRVAQSEAQLTQARNKLHDINEQFRASENAKNAVMANSKRLMEGMIQLTGKQEQQVGRLAKVAPKTAINISTKFADPIDAGNVAAAAKRTLGKGVTVKTVNKIVADSTNADQAIARLKAVRVTSKWRVIEQGGKSALALAERLNGKRRLSDAQKRIITRGGPQALSEIARIDQRKISPKSVVVRAQTAQAQANISAVISAINSIPGFKDIYIRAHTSAAAKTGGTAKGGGGSFGRGPASDYVTERSMAQANRKAIGRIATAGRVSTPTYLVGEEGTSEFVISSNPTYRRRNRKILAEAARTIGWDPEGGPLPQKKIRLAKRGSQVTAHPGLPASVTTLPVPNPYSVAAVDESAAETSVTAWRSEKARRKGLLASIRKQKAAEKKDWDKKKGKATKAEKAAHAKKMAKLNSDHNDLIHGLAAEDTGDPIKTVPYAQVSKAVTKGGQDLARLKHANADIAHDNAEIASDRTRIDRMASIYANPNTSPDQKKKAKQEYDRVKANRLTSIKHLVKLLDRAKGAATALAQMAPWSDQMRATLDSITGQNEDALTELDTSQNEPDATDVPDTAETFIERMGFTKALKDDLLAASIATTTTTTTDDEAARKALFDLYGQQIIPAALADPAAKENTDLLTELYTAQGSYAPNADNQTSANQNLDAINQQTADRTAAQLRGDLVDSATLQAFRGNGNYGGNALLQSYFGPPAATQQVPSNQSRIRTVAEATATGVTSGPPSGTGNGATKGGHTTVNINALTANPRDAIQAASTIVSGMGYQGGRAPSATPVGA